uniref:SCP domain-containing protein n=1 Tax=Meloidogyne javanica TaxID=6303 RepID=A0A915LFL7_MELJA
MNFLNYILFVVVVVEIGTKNKLIEPVHALLSNEQKFVQDRHNWRRSQLAGGQSQNKTGMMPTGKNIWTMKYDASLEASAQAWTNQCTMTHSGSPNGENGCFLSNQETNVVNALSTCCDLWWAELVNNGAPSDLVLTSSNWYPTGHWSQLIRNVAMPYGNYMGQKIYEPGPVCSGCNVVNGQLQCQYGLCI